MERRDPGPRAAPSISAHGLPQQGCIMFHFPSSKEGKNISKSFFFFQFSKKTLGMKLLFQLQMITLIWLPSLHLGIAFNNTL